MKRGREEFSKYKKYIVGLSQLYSVFPLSVRLRLFEMHRNFKGKIGIGIRYALIKSIAYRCGDNVVIYPGAYILNPQYLSIGDNVSIHPMCYIECGKNNADIVIGNDVSIAHGVTIMPSSHNYDSYDINIKDQGVAISPIQIENNTWIGAKATILSGITIKTGCIIGANAVVTKDTEMDGVYVGVPAKRIKLR